MFFNVIGAIAPVGILGNVVFLIKSQVTFVYYPEVGGFINR